MTDRPRSAAPAPAPAFDLLLGALDPDREKAGERYEALRRKLIRLFTWRGCLDAELCADETLDRVGRRIGEGASVPDVAGFCHGVAINVLREHWRSPERRTTPLDTLPVPLGPQTDPALLGRESDARHAREARLRCLELCVGRLDPAARALLTRYHSGAPPAWERRAALARDLGLPLNALRIRAHRLRAALARCIEGCSGRAEEP
jgi:DNA-directed RNA polymerase specialized sigma24 family protein